MSRTNLLASWRYASAVTQKTIASVTNPTVVAFTFATITFAVSAAQNSPRSVTIVVGTSAVFAVDFFVGILPYVADALVAPARAGVRANRPVFRLLTLSHVLVRVRIAVALASRTVPKKNS